MQQHAGQRPISREYIRQVTFADAPTLAEVIDELRQAGLVRATGELLRLDSTPEVRQALNALALAFEEPTQRQELLRLLHRNPAGQLWQRRFDSPGRGI